MVQSLVKKCSLAHTGGKLINSCAACASSLGRRRGVEWRRDADDATLEIKTELKVNGNQTSRKKIKEIIAGSFLFVCFFKKNILFNDFDLVLSLPTLAAGVFLLCSKMPLEAVKTFSVKSVPAVCYTKVCMVRAACSVKKKKWMHLFFFFRVLYVSLI